MKKLIVCFIVIFSSLLCNASQKIYLIHGYGGPGFEMNSIFQSLKKQKYNCEIFTYPSLVKDVDTVGVELFQKIQIENFDTVSFVTHSMGALVVRSLYNRISSVQKFPIISRIVMIAPPNNGSPVADFFVQFQFLKFIVGPNVNNLTTDPVTGAAKYPIPTCEVGLIAGSFGGKKGYNIFVKGDNDGVLIPEDTKMGIEKDVIFIRSWHVGLLYNKKVIKHVSEFLKNGRFSKT